MQKQRVVWKLGGSVLEDESSYNLLAQVVQEYLNSTAKLERLYIVVSAMKGDIDRRVKAAAPEDSARQFLGELLSGSAENESCHKFDAPQLSSFLLEGEMESAHRLQKALEVKDLKAKVVTQHDYFPIASRGSYFRGEFDFPLSSSRFDFFEKLTRDFPVVILSGFGAVNEKKEPTLLGRNASDYVAALISRLDKQVREVVYVKDVQGIYENFSSPNRKLINLIDRLELLNKGEKQVLDQRVLDVISCDFFVTDVKMEKGHKEF